MMSRIQKYLLWLFGAMFLVPEILWSPIVNFYYELSQTSVSGSTHPLRDNFLQNSDNLDYLKIVFFVQSISLLIFIIIFIKSRQSIKVPLPIFSIITIILLLIFLMLIFALGFVSTFTINIM